MPIAEDLLIYDFQFVEDNPELVGKIRTASSSWVEESTMAKAMLVLAAIADGSPSPKLTFRLVPYCASEVLLRVPHTSIVWGAPLTEGGLFGKDYFHGRS